MAQNESSSHSPKSTVELQRTNGLAIAGFILAFTVPPLGLIFSIIGLVKAKSFKDDGKILSIIGIVVSVFMSLMMLFIIVALVATSFANINRKAEEAEQKTKANISKHHTDAPEKLELGDIYNEKTGIFSITLPKGWKEIQSEGGWYVTAGLPSKSGGYVSTTNISVDKLRAGENFSEYMAAETVNLSEGSGAITSKAAIFINGINGYEIIATNVTGSSLPSGYIVILNKADSVYRLGYYTSPERIRAYLPTFKESAKSFVVK